MLAIRNIKPLTILFIYLEEFFRGMIWMTQGHGTLFKKV